jgi:hypothetical protein
MVAIGRYPALKILRHNFLPTSDAILSSIRQNRTIREYIQTYGSLANAEEIVRALAQNWTLEIAVGLCSKWCNDSVETDDYTEHAAGCLIAEYLGRNRSSGKRVALRLTENICIALLPLGLTTQEMLLILDWVPPIHYRFEWRGDPEYDPWRASKVHLIEGLQQSYQKLTHR